MLNRMYLLAGVLCAGSYALAASPSIGSVSARGETRVDSYDVRGSGTVFDGSVVETGQSVSSAADLRLRNNEEIDLWRDSRGTLYQDHFVLQRGSAALNLTDSFRVQANGIVVVPTEAHTSGIVTIGVADSVTVESKGGTLEIRNAAGGGIARVRPGHPLTFSSAAGKPSAEFSSEGTVSSKNGHYYLDSSETGMKYELTGDNLQSYDGASVVVSGILDGATSAAAGIDGALLASSIQLPNSTSLLGKSSDSFVLTRGLTVTKGTAADTTRVCPPSLPVPCCPQTPTPVCCNPLSAQQCSKSN
jgi:hypothetical protein